MYIVVVLLLLVVGGLLYRIGERSKLSPDDPASASKRNSPSFVVELRQLAHHQLILHFFS